LAQGLFPVLATAEGIYHELSEVMEGMHPSTQAAEAAVGSFVKYDKMGESSGAVGAAAVPASNKYIVTEKVHGANFCLIARFAHNGGDVMDVQFAKRTAILGGADDAEDFYSCRSAGLLRKLAPCAERALRLKAVEAPTRVLGAVHIYGELFGGSYPHPDVSEVPGLEPVQIGVWYSPNLEFMAFDVAVEAHDGGRTFLDFAAARDLCVSAGLMFAQPLCTGSLSECLDYPIEFTSTIPGLLGLPALPPADEKNLAEGVVVRPFREPPKRQSSSSSKTGKESGRGLFKRKIEAFSEKRYQNDDWKKGKAGGGGQAPVMSSEDLASLEVAALVTEQRLANVLSKIGRVDAADKQACREVLQGLKDDVAEALDPAEAQVLQSSQQVQEELDSLCRKLITRELAPRLRRRGM